MMRTIPDLLAALGALLPPWVTIPLAVLIAAVALPGWYYWLRTKQIRGALRSLLRATDEAARRRHRERAFELTGGRPRRVAYLADEAIRLHLKGVWQRALSQLEQSAPAEARRLRAKVEPPPRRPSHPLEEAVVIERMWEQGLHDAARARLHEVRTRFPDDEELAALEQRLG